MARQRVNLDPERQPQPHLRCCDRPGCPHEGAFRAPRSRATLHSYYWFCLDHVREYNAAWNFYAGMDPREIEAELRQDSVWQRPTWPMGWRTAGARGAFRDPFQVFDDDESGPNGTSYRPGMRQRPLSAEEQAMQVFDLNPPFSLQELKTRYKLLVKQHHPDANGGDKAAEERLKVINQAYATLKASFSN